MHFWDASCSVARFAIFAAADIANLARLCDDLSSHGVFFAPRISPLKNWNTWHYDRVLYWLYNYWSILTILYLYCTNCTIIIHNHYIQYYNQLFECFSMYTVHGLERLESMNPVLRLFNVSNPTGQLGFEDWQSYVDLSRYVRIKMFWLATLTSLALHISCYQHWFCL